MNAKEKIQELLKNEEFIAQAKEAGGVEGLRNVFAQYGVELSNEQVEGFVQAVYADASAGGDELDAGQLDAVSGGKGDVWGYIWGAIKSGWDTGRKLGDWYFDTFG